jgi:hypothetical protein
VKVRLHDDTLVCDGCGKEATAVVDAPTRGGGPWGHFCGVCVDSWAIAHWRESQMTTMLVRTMDDAF